jgi:hypothetical protein
LSFIFKGVSKHLSFSCLYTACTFDIHLYLTPLGQARQFIETCGTYNLLCGRKCFFLGLVCYFCTASPKINILTAQYKQISNEQGV